MADIIIKGMDMPLFKTELIVFPSGVVQVYDSSDNYLGKAQAVPLPAGHGRLIDADALGDFPYNISFCDEGDIENWIANAPTIVPAEGGTEDV